jgi:BASS family bile acid:Na+ symporter
MVLNKHSESFVKKISFLTKKLPIYLLLILITVFFIENRKVIIDNFSELSLLVLILVVLVMITSDLISRALRIKLEQRKTIVIGVGIKNAAQAILIATSPFILYNPKIGIPAVLYALIMNIVVLTYVGLYIKRKKTK